MSLLARSLQPCRCTRAFSTSSTVQAESQRKRTARLKKKTNIERRRELNLEQQRTIPNPILGYHDAATWESSKLKTLLVKRESVWQEQLRRGVGGRDQETLDMNATSAEAEDVLDFDDALDGRRWNFGLDDAEAQLLFQDLPRVSAQKALIGQSENTSVERLEELAGQAEKEELAKRDQLMRIVDLKNANARGVRLDNTRRVVKEFSRLPDGKDTGSPEVQVAVMTLRIRNIASHLSQAKKDHSNAKQLRALISKRAKMFRYLKKKSLDRYNAALAACGLEPRAVEGEVLVLEQDIKGLVGLSV